MSVLKTGRFSAQPPVEGVEAEALGLSLIEARAIYDAWRASPYAPSRRLVYRSAIVWSSPAKARQVLKYLTMNRTKWASFCAQAAGALDASRARWLKECAEEAAPRCLCTLHESCKVCRVSERKRKPYAYSADDLAKSTPVKRPFTTVLCGRKMGKTHAARQAARRPLEATQQAKLIGLCKAQGWWAYKTEAPGFAGIPDLQILNPSKSILLAGRIAFVEMKRPGEKPTALQMHVIEELNTAGFFAFWADDPVQAFDYLKRVWSDVHPPQKRVRR